MIARAATAVALVTLAFGASAQQPGAGAFKGKVKPGLYEDKIEVAVPGEKDKRTMTRQRCATDKDIETLAEESDASCKTSNFRMAGDKATFVIACKGAQEMSSNVQVTMNATGYVTESTATMTAPGKAPMTVKQVVASRYVGACPAAAPAGKK